MTMTRKGRDDENGLCPNKPLKWKFWASYPFALGTSRPMHALHKKRATLRARECRTVFSGPEQFLEWPKLLGQDGIGSISVDPEAKEKKIGLERRRGQWASPSRRRRRKDLTLSGHARARAAHRCSSSSLLTPKSRSTDCSFSFRH